MKIEHLFLFEYVPKGSRVIIYGLGKVGKCYIEQIARSQWCDIVGISDQRVLDGMFSYPFYSLDELPGADSFDYIIIAIEDSNVAGQVYEILFDFGIPEEKIVNLNMRKEGFRHQIDLPTAGQEISETLYVALRLCGGLGDYVVYLSVYEKLVEMIPNAVLDIFCNDEFGKPLYCHKKNVRHIYAEKVRLPAEEYDLVLSLAHYINIEKMDIKKLKVFFPQFYEKIKCFSKGIYAENALNLDYRYTVILKRALIMGYNRYRTLGGGDILDLYPELSKIDMTSEAEKRFGSFSLKKYITLNYGADKLSYIDKMQTKVWPLEYFERFVSLFKMSGMDYEIIQVGAASATKIKGVDKYFLGQDLELVKYLLKYSSIHLDCEGGLVHLATRLGTKCLVLFGPTPLEYYGYEQNINLRAGICPGCMGVIRDWYVTCYRGDEKPKCMYGIAPEWVLDEMRAYLEENG